MCRQAALWQVSFPYRRMYTQPVYARHRSNLFDGPSLRLGYLGVVDRRWLLKPGSICFLH